MRPPFLSQASRLLNSGQTRTIILSGNIYDLFPLSLEDGTESRVKYSPLTDVLCSFWDVHGVIVIRYEINGPIRFHDKNDLTKVRSAYIKWRAHESGQTNVASPNPQRLAEAGRVFDESFRKAATNSSLALELMRQMCMCSRASSHESAYLAENILIIIEGADMIIPEAPITQTSDKDRQRMMICQDWFSDPEFVDGNDSVVLLAESRSLVHHRVSRLPQILEVEVGSPDLETRLHFIQWFQSNIADRINNKVRMWGSEDDLAELSAGLSIHALNQMLKAASYDDETLEAHTVVAKVESFIQSQVGEDVVEFKKPEHKIEELVGFTSLKKFLKMELIPRFSTSGPEALPGAAVGGPIGGGKTYIFEAVASELGMVVLVLKSIRSKWYGETDLIFERLKRVLMALSRVLIFIDEADTQLGGVGSETMDTERRLTGKIQSMMSDPILRGRVFWLLVTARIHLLSPDIRRPGRVGDLIIPILDPEGDDRIEFIHWMVGNEVDLSDNEDALEKLKTETHGFSAATFASIRSELKAASSRLGHALSVDEVIEILHDRLDPAIAETRQYQTLQALLNCTRRQLLPDPNITDGDRLEWKQKITLLEAKGIS